MITGLAFSGGTTTAPLADGVPEPLVVLAAVAGADDSVEGVAGVALGVDAGLAGEAEVTGAPVTIVWAGVETAARANTQTISRRVFMISYFASNFWAAPQGSCFGQLTFC